jgi:putative ABC transport system permease protein
MLSIPQRRGSVVAALFGVAGVVAVFVGVLSIASGFKRAMTSSGDPAGAIVLRGGADGEMASGLGLDETRIIGDSPGVARTTDGSLASAELFVIINLPKRIRAQMPMFRSAEWKRLRSACAKSSNCAGPAF